MTTPANEPNAVVFESDASAREMVDRAVYAALISVLREASLWEVIRVICAMRWGKLGRDIESKMRSPGRAPREQTP